jgi:sec-independent protein translocase protein TatA
MTVANLFGALEGPELLIILALVLLLFGGAKLPQLARSLGHAKREFHDAIKEPSAETSSDSAPASVATSATEDDSAGDSVTVSRAELDRLRAAAARARPETFN